MLAPPNMAIEQIIRQAFVGTEPPSCDLFSTSNTEGAEELFIHARWKQISIRQLQPHSASINFLSAAGFAYFLPAFMLAVLSEPGISGSLMYKLTPPKDDPFRSSYAAWWSLLSEQQQKAVVEFIEHSQATGDEFPLTALAALRSSFGANKSFKADA